MGKKWSSYVLLGESLHLWPTFLCNERVLQHDTIFFVQSSAVRGLRLWHVLKKNCGANVCHIPALLVINKLFYFTRTFLATVCSAVRPLTVKFMGPGAFNLRQALYSSNKSWHDTTERLYWTIVMYGKPKHSNLQHGRLCDQLQSAWTSRKQQSQQV